MIEKDVVIIGGGSTGLATAYYLSELGLKDLALLEKDYVGSGSTGRCGTGIRAQFANEATITTMKRAEGLWKQLATDLGFEFRQTGYLYLHYSDQALNKYRGIKTLQNSLGVPTEILSPADAKSLCNPLDVSKVKGASYNPQDGKAHPFEVVAGFRNYLQSGSADLKEGTEVTGISLKKGGKVKIVQTTNEEYKTEILVNAAGGWAARVGEMMDLDIPIKPFRHQAIITEPIRSETIEPVIISMKHEEAYLTQTERGGVIGGVSTPEDEPPTYETRETLEFQKRVSRAFSSIIPGLKRARILRQWGGYYAMSPDANPLLGEFGPPGHYVAVGFSGHGYMMSPAVGLGLAELIYRGKTDLPLEFYDPERIERGELRESDLQMG
ncbi:MAG: NAD(P)/FAD-dependent oxidoreductase [Candidatus Acetothermia bacterium]